MKHYLLPFVCLISFTSFLTGCFPDDPENDSDDKALSLSTSPSSLDFPAAGGEKGFIVKTGYDYWWAEKGSGDWFDGYYNDYDTGVDVVVQKNTTTKSRSGVFYIYGSKDGDAIHRKIEVKITQAAGSGDSEADKLQLAWGANVDSFTKWEKNLSSENNYLGDVVYHRFIIKTGQANVKVSSNVDWLTLENPTKGTGGIWTSGFKLNPNKTKDKRVGIAKISALNGSGKVVEETTITVTQYGDYSSYKYLLGTWKSSDGSKELTLTDECSFSKNWGSSKGTGWYTVLSYTATKQSSASDVSNYFFSGKLKEPNGTEVTYSGREYGTFNGYSWTYTCTLEYQGETLGYTHH